MSFFFLDVSRQTHPAGDEEQVQLHFRAIAHIWRHAKTRRASISLADA